MSAWYRTRWHDSYSSAEVKEVEVVKTTDACVYLKEMRGRRLSKRSNFENFFENRQEAVDFIVDSLAKKQAFYQKQSDMYFDAYNKWRRDGTDATSVPVKGKE